MKITLLTTEPGSASSTYCSDYKVTIADDTKLMNLPIAGESRILLKHLKNGESPIGYFDDLEACVTWMNGLFADANFTDALAKTVSCMETLSSYATTASLASGTPSVHCHVFISPTGESAIVATKGKQETDLTLSLLLEIDYGEGGHAKFPCVTGAIRFRPCPYKQNTWKYNEPSISTELYFPL